MSTLPAETILHRVPPPSYWLEVVYFKLLRHWVCLLFDSTPLVSDLYKQGDYRPSPLRSPYCWSIATASSHHPRSRLPVYTVILLIGLGSFALSLRECLTLFPSFLSPQLIPTALYVPCLICNTQHSVSTVPLWISWE